MPNIDVGSTTGGRTHPDWNTWELWEGLCDRPGAGFVGELRDSDEELLAGEQHVGALELGVRIGYLDDGQVQLFLQNRSRVFNLNEKN